MIFRIYAIRDNKTDHYAAPFVQQHDIDATRMFHRACKDDTVQFSHFPEDFDLYQLGEFDDTIGKLIASPAPRFIVSATSFTKLQNKEKEGPNGNVQK